MSNLQASNIHARTVSSDSAANLRKSERTRKAILDAAVEFLWSRPFRELTVGELMSMTGNSRSAFYPYFTDLHDLMETLLRGIEVDILQIASPWLSGEGDPKELLQESIAGEVRICYQRGPVIRAVADASITDEWLERAWAKFLGKFDDAVTVRIKQHQKQGLIPPFAARPVAVALNRLDVSMFVDAFGRRPRKKPGPVRDVLTRIWTSTLYPSSCLPQAGKTRRRSRRKKVRA